MDMIKVAKIRPTSWRISVEGREGSEYVRQLFQRLKLQTTEPIEEPGLTDPPLFAFVVQYPDQTPLISNELQQILQSDAGLDVRFDVS